MKCLVLIFFCTLVLSIQGDSICKKYLRELSSSDALFTQCASNNAVPVTLCLSCKDQYYNLTKAYKTLIEAVDKNITCKNVFFDKDRLNIVETIYQDLNGLWEKAYCSECFTNFNETTSILEAITKFEGCITSKKHPCVDCKGSYLNINGLYNNMTKNNNGKICFDIQDKMNRSRVIWSNDLKCCKRESNLEAFTVLSSSLMILPILFYGSLIIFTRRAERNHGILDNTNGDGSTSVIERNATNQNAESNTTQHITILPTNNGPSSSSPKRSSPEKSLQKKENQSNLDLSESSDDELLRENNDRRHK